LGKCLSKSERTVRDLEYICDEVALLDEFLAWAESFAAVRAEVDLLNRTEVLEKDGRDVVGRLEGRVGL
jgi:hypothetical protein